MISLPKPQKFESRLISLEKISEKVYLETYQLVNPAEIIFVAGQTVMLYVSPTINRSMSIASVPDEKTSISLIHDVSPMGPYSKWTLAAKPGDPMSFMGPLGVFVVDRESPRKKVFIATGSGIAPFYSMARDYLTHGGTDDLTLYWGVRHEGDLFWREEFESLTQQYANFRFVLTLSQPMDSWQGKRGHVQEQIFADEQNLSGTDFYLCGNRDMVRDMKTKLAAAQVPPAQVKSELFY